MSDEIKNLKAELKSARRTIKRLLDVIALADRELERLGASENDVRLGRNKVAQRIRSVLKRERK